MLISVDFKRLRISEMQGIERILEVLILEELWREKYEIKGFLTNDSALDERW